MRPPRKFFPSTNRRIRFKNSPACTRRRWRRWRRIAIARERRWCMSLGTYIFRSRPTLPVGAGNAWPVWTPVAELSSRSNGNALESIGSHDNTDIIRTILGSRETYSETTNREKHGLSPPIKFTSYFSSPYIIGHGLRMKTFVCCDTENTLLYFTKNATTIVNC